MFKFFYFFRGIYTSTYNGSINVTESVASNMNDCFGEKNKNQCNQISYEHNSTDQFLEQEDLELGKIIENALDLEEELQLKNRLSYFIDNPIFDTINFQCFQNNNNVTGNETLETPVMKKFKLEDTNKCITSENARHLEGTFQSSPNIYCSSTSNTFIFQKQYDEGLNSDKTINEQNDIINCNKIVRLKDKKGPFYKLYDVYVEKFNRYLMSKKKLSNNLIFQNKTVQYSNQQFAHLDLFMDFCKEVLNRLKSAFDEAKNEQILTSKKVFHIEKKDKKSMSELSKIRRSYYGRKNNFNKTINRQMKKIEENSFFKKSSCKSVKELIVECNMFIKEVLKYYLSFELTAKLQNKSLQYTYNECKDISQRYTNISQKVKLECIVVIIKMCIERLEYSRDFLVKINYNLKMLFNSVTRLSTDINWLISPLKNIMDVIYKE